LYAWAFDRFTMLLDNKLEAEDIDVSLTSERNTPKSSRVWRVVAQTTRNVSSVDCAYVKRARRLRTQA
jgi:transposase